MPCVAARKYYSQRTVKGGLLLTEATCINDQAHGYSDLGSLSQGVLASSNAF